MRHGMSQMPRHQRHREMMTRHLRKTMRERGVWDKIMESAKKNPRNPVAKYLLDREEEHKPNLTVVKEEKI